MSETAVERIAREPIDYKRIGMKPITDRVLLPPGEANTSKVGIALSKNLLRRIDALAKERLPDRRYPRSSYVRQLIRAGLEAEEGADWESRADQILHPTDEGE